MRLPATTSSFLFLADMERVTNWPARILSLLLTGSLIFFTIYHAKTGSGSFIAVVIVFLCCLYGGMILRTNKKQISPLLLDLAWGLFYGSACMFVLFLIFIIMVAIALKDGF